MRIRVHLRSPTEILAPNLPPGVREALPDLVLPEGATVEDLLRRLGVGRARPVVLVNRVQQRENAPLREGDEVELALPLGGG